MSRVGGSDHRSGDWLVNTIIAVMVGLVVAVVVVGASILIDRHSAPGIEIVHHQPAAPKVHISGAVATPGVYSLPANARLADAIAAGGGLSARADPSGINLAARVGDGERIVIPAIEEAQPSEGESTPAGPGMININTATAAELEVLPGIGPVLAGRIVDDREANGPFLGVDGLTRVDGISAATVDEVRDLVTIDE